MGYLVSSFSSLRRTTSTPFFNKALAQAEFAGISEVQSERLLFRVRACRGDSMALPKKLDQDSLGATCVFESFASPIAVYGICCYGSVRSAQTWKLLRQPPKPPCYVTWAAGKDTFNKQR